MALTNPMPMGPWKVRKSITASSRKAHHCIVIIIIIIMQQDKSSSFFCALQITVYDQEYFQGRRMEFTACCQNIMECGMENIRSLKVECGAYVHTQLLLKLCKCYGSLKKTNKLCTFYFDILEHQRVIVCLPAVGWGMSTLASVGSSLSWRRETTLVLRLTAAATPTALRG